MSTFYGFSKTEIENKKNESGPKKAGKKLFKTERLQRRKRMKNVENL